MAKEQSPITLVTRTRNRWKDTGRSKSLEDNATALGYIIWQLALNGAKNLHVEDFRYDDDRQRVGVIEEYLAFLVHLSDRLAYDLLDHDQRPDFVSGVVSAVARHLQRNKEDVFGRSNYREGLLGLLNCRAEEYGSCTFRSGAPGYQMLRVLGGHVQRIMGSDQTNKWVIDQVMDIDAPDMASRLRQSLLSLLKTT